MRLIFASGGEVKTIKSPEFRSPEIGIFVRESHKPACKLEVFTPES